MSERPEDIVEASFEAWPAKRPVFEIAGTPAARLCARLGAAGVTLTPEELEAQLADAGFTLHGSAAGRRKARPAAARALADSVRAAFEDGAQVFAVRTRPRGEGGAMAPGLWHMGPPEALPALVSTALAGWLAPRRPTMLVIEGEEVPPPGPAWQASLQALADRLQVTLSVRHQSAGVTRWMRATAPLAQVDVRLPGGRRCATEVLRVYARRPSKPPAPRRVDVRDAPVAHGRRRITAEGRPASRWYRVEPNPPG